MGDPYRTPGVIPPAKPEPPPEPKMCDECGHREHRNHWGDSQCNYVYVGIFSSRECLCGSRRYRR